MDKILITGGSGLLGSNLSRLYRDRASVTATYNQHLVSTKGVRFIRCDLTRSEDLLSLQQIAPNLIIHCAAQTDVDLCEDQPEQAHDQNVIASENIARTARNVGAYLIHISTDCVFDGIRGNYREDDATNPVNTYGKTKLMAEQIVRAVHPRSAVVRTNIYGWNKTAKFSLAEWMLDRLENKKELPGFKDITSSPLLVNDLAEILLDLAGQQFEGVIHVAGAQSCSKLDFAEHLADLFNLDKTLIKGISINDSSLTAPRAPNLSLDVSRVEKLIGAKCPGVREGLARFKSLRDEGYVEKLKNE